MNSFALNAYGEIGICVISQQETFSIRALACTKSGSSSLQITLSKTHAGQRSASNAVSSRCAECALRTAKWKIGSGKPG